MNTARFVDIHVLQTVPASLLNRDDQGMSKTVTMGGSPRIRVSSQCWKRATRMHMEDALSSTDGYLFDRSLRTRRPFDVLAAVLVTTHGWSDSDAATAARAIFAAYVKVTKSATAATPVAVSAANSEEVATEVTPAPEVDMSDASSVLLFLTESQYADLADIAAANQGDIIAIGANMSDKKKKAPAKAIVDPLRKALNDVIAEPRGVISLFGRMIAQLPSGNVNSAVQVGQAFTVHAASTEFDYFTAVDDVVSDKGETGAGHLGITEFSAVTYYRNATIDLDSLRDTAGEAANILAAQFMTSFIDSIPSAKSTSSAANTPPALIIIEVRGDRPLSYAAAFEAPVTQDGAGFVTPAITRITDHANLIGASYATPPLFHAHLQTVTTDPAVVASLTKTFGAPVRMSDLQGVLAEHLQ